ncbi:hypothetical protein VP01_416g2 [Puccinia sorghi]|uniref:Uncharacterized protein n=1 Tax=Puccinia sorghi TaxID=27349 RepID=A0A0L6URS4_9BASI|nr:hypothetical protein VP01_416g2 [Puccinia sorghi]
MSATELSKLGIWPKTQNFSQCNSGAYVDHTIGKVEGFSQIQLHLLVLFCERYNTQKFLSILFGIFQSILKFLSVNWSAKSQNGCLCGPGSRTSNPWELFLQEPKFFTLKSVGKNDHHQICFNLTPKKINKELIHLCTTNWFHNPPRPSLQHPMGCRTKKGGFTSDVLISIYKIDYDGLSHWYFQRFESDHLRKKCQNFYDKRVKNGVRSQCELGYYQDIKIWRNRDSECPEADFGRMPTYPNDCKNGQVGVYKQAWNHFYFKGTSCHLRSADRSPSYLPDRHRRLSPSVVSALLPVVMFHSAARYALLFAALATIALMSSAHAAGIGPREPFMKQPGYRGRKGRVSSTLDTYPASQKENPRFEKKYRKKLIINKVEKKLIINKPPISTNLPRIRVVWELIFGLKSCLNYWFLIVVLHPSLLTLQKILAQLPAVDMQKVQQGSWCYSHLSSRVIQPCTDCADCTVTVLKHLHMQTGGFGWQLGWSMLHVNCRQLTKFFFAGMKINQLGPVDVRILLLNSWLEQCNKLIKMDGMPLSNHSLYIVLAVSSCYTFLTESNSYFSFSSATVTRLSTGLHGYMDIACKCFLLTWSYTELIPVVCWL